MIEKQKRKNDEVRQKRASSFRIIALALLFLGLYVWVAPITIVVLMSILLLSTLDNPLLLISVAIAGLLLAIQICWGIIYIFSSFGKMLDRVNVRQAVYKRKNEEANP